MGRNWRICLPFFTRKRYLLLIFLLSFFSLQDRLLFSSVLHQTENMMLGKEERQTILQEDWGQRKERKNHAQESLPSLFLYFLRLFFSVIPSVFHSFTSSSRTSSTFSSKTEAGLKEHTRNSRRETNFSSSLFFDSVCLPLMTGNFVCESCEWKETKSESVVVIETK